MVYPVRPDLIHVTMMYRKKEGCERSDGFWVLFLDGMEEYASYISAERLRATEWQEEKNKQLENVNALFAPLEERVTMLGLEQLSLDETMTEP